MNKVFAVTHTRAYRDRDNYPVSDTEIEVDEGVFASREAAEAVAYRLNEFVRSQHAKHVENVEKRNASAKRVAKQNQAELDALVAAGLRPASSRVPSFQPEKVRTYEEFLRYQAADSTASWYGTEELNFHE